MNKTYTISYLGSLGLATITKNNHIDIGAIQGAMVTTKDILSYLGPLGLVTITENNRIHICAIQEAKVTTKDTLC